MFMTLIMREPSLKNKSSFTKIRKKSQHYHTKSQNLINVTSFTYYQQEQGPHLLQRNTQNIGHLTFTCPYINFFPFFCLFSFVGHIGQPYFTGHQHQLSATLLFTCLIYSLEKISLFLSRPHQSATFYRPLSPIVGHSYFLPVSFTHFLSRPHQLATFYKPLATLIYIIQVFSNFYFYFTIFSRQHQSATSPVPLAGIAATFIIFKTLILY